jgi:hypothetical protein
MPVLEAMRRWQLSKIAPEAVQRGKHCAVLRQNEPSVSNDDNRWCSLPDHIVEMIVWELRQLVLQEQADPKVSKLCIVVNSARSVQLALTGSAAMRSHRTIEHIIVSYITDPRVLCGVLSLLMPCRAFCLSVASAPAGGTSHATCCSAIPGAHTVSFATQASSSLW